MPDPAGSRRRRVLPGWLFLAATVAFAAAAPVAVLAGDQGRLVGIAEPGERAIAMAPPLETCAPGETRRVGGFEICNVAGGGGDSGFNLGGLLPIVGIMLVGGLVALIAAFVVLRRTSTPLVPADPGEWWTCRSCGKNNVLGSARCYACGGWQR